MRTQRIIYLPIIVILFVVLIQTAYSEEPCPTCQGRKSVPCSACGGSGRGSTYVVVNGLPAYDGCLMCGGTPAGRNPFRPGTPGCGSIPCPSCGGTGLKQQSSTSNQPPTSDSDAQRQKTLEEQRKKEQQEAKRKKEEFEKAKQEALKSLKGIAEIEFGLKGIDETGNMGLKGIEEIETDNFGLKGIGDSSTPAPVDSSLVDLRHLDPNKPITVDPHVVRGEERVFPVQPDPETFTNANYNEGFECLKRHDPYAAVRYFEQARQERPQDPLIRNALYLAQDMIKQREQNNLEERRRMARELAAKATAQIAAYPQYAALPALWLREAYRLCPEDQEIRDASSIAYGMFLEQQRSVRQSPEQKEREERALRKADTCVSFVVQKNYTEAIRILKEAQAISPGQFNIENTLAFLEGVESERNKVKEQNDQINQEQKEIEEQALRKADTCVPFIFKENYAEAIRILKEAQTISPGQRNIENTLSYLEGLELGRAKINKDKEQNKE